VLFQPAEVKHQAPVVAERDLGQDAVACWVIPAGAAAELENAYVVRSYQVSSAVVTKTQQQWLIAAEREEGQVAAVKIQRRPTVALETLPWLVLIRSNRQTSACLTSAFQIALLGGPDVES
jgi:hypothetical protein